MHQNCKHSPAEPSNGNFDVYFLWNHKHSLRFYSDNTPRSFTPIKQITKIFVATDDHRLNLTDFGFLNKHLNATVFWMNGTHAIFKHACMCLQQRQRDVMLGCVCARMHVFAVFRPVGFSSIHVPFNSHTWSVSSVVDL